MGRVVIPILSLVTVGGDGGPIWDFAHDDLGIAVNTIRTDALASAGFILVIQASESLLRRNK